MFHGHSQCTGHDSQSCERKEHTFEGSIFLCFAPENNDLKWLPSNLYYKTHLSRQWTCWSFRCSWSIVCRRCSNYIFIIDLTPDFNGLGKDNCKTRRESFNFCDSLGLILIILRYIHSKQPSLPPPQSWQTAREEQETANRPCSKPFSFATGCLY